VKVEDTSVGALGHPDLLSKAVNFVSVKSKQKATMTQILGNFLNFTLSKTSRQIFTI
jgi:hypothetical protein